MKSITNSPIAIRIIAIAIIALFLIRGKIAAQNVENQQPITVLNNIELLKDTSMMAYSILSPYNFSIGSNLDFSDKISFKDLYLNISTFSPNLFKIKNLSIGLNTGLRKNYASNFQDFVQTITKIDKIYDSESEQFIKLESTLNRTGVLGLRVSDFYFNPIFLLTEKVELKKGNKSNFFQLYLSIETDIVRHQGTYNYSFDTLKTNISIISENEFNEINPSTTTTVSTFEQYLYSVGIGLPFIIENKNAAFLGKIWGGYNKKVIDKTEFDRVHIGFTFEIIEKEFGLNLRSEIRFFGVRQPTYISLSLAKYFSLKRLINFIPSDY